MMLKGMTVRYLLRATYKLQAGETILLHAAAGGIGLIMGLKTFSLMMLVMNMLVAVRPTGQQASLQQTARLKNTPRCGQIRLRHLSFTATTD
jgi:hypothetical protein